MSLYPPAPLMDSQLLSASTDWQLSVLKAALAGQLPYEAAAAALSAPVNGGRAEPPAATHLQTPQGLLAMAEALLRPQAATPQTPSLNFEAYSAEHQLLLEAELMAHWKAAALQSLSQDIAEHRASLARQAATGLYSRPAPLPSTPTLQQREPAYVHAAQQAASAAASHYERPKKRDNHTRGGQQYQQSGRQAGRQGAGRAQRSASLQCGRGPGGNIVPRAPTWADASWHPMAAVVANRDVATDGTGVFLPSTAPSACGPVRTADLSAAEVSREDVHAMMAQRAAAGSAASSGHASATILGLEDDVASWGSFGCTAAAAGPPASPHGPLSLARDSLPESLPDEWVY